MIQKRVRYIATVFDQKISSLIDADDDDNNDADDDDNDDGEDYLIFNRMNGNNSHNDIHVLISIRFLNPYHAEFLKWNNVPYTFGTVHYHFRDIKIRT